MMDSKQDDAVSQPGEVRSSAQLGLGANNLARDPYRLDFVLMPLVKMMAEQELSWSQREQVAHAMLATMRHHKSMADEMQMHAERGDSASTQGGGLARAIKAARGVDGFAAET